MEVFKEVLELFIKVPNPMGKCCVMWLDDEDSPPPKQSKWNLDCE